MIKKSTFRVVMGGGGGSALWRGSCWLIELTEDEVCERELSKVVT